MIAIKYITAAIPASRLVMTAFVTTAILTFGITTAFSQNTGPKINNMAQAIFDEVIFPDLKRTQTAISNLQSSLAEITTSESVMRSEKITQQFTDIVAGWKAVETIYFAGELDSDFLDTPRLIDSYHYGNENLKKSLVAALSSGDEPRIALYKNTYKSIQALAYFLFSDSKITNIERQYASYTLMTIHNHLNDIIKAYQQNQDSVLKNPKMANAVVLNALIDSSYKLKEWRIGDVAGLSKKFNNQPNLTRQEYPISQKSLHAIRSIIDTHNKVIGDKTYKNLGSEAIDMGVNDTTKLIRQLITQAKQQASELNNADLSTVAAKPLFNTLSELNKAYYQTLVNALAVQAKILDADGD